MPAYNVVYTNFENADFLMLVERLDAYYYQRYGELSVPYRRFNLVDTLTDVVVLYDAHTPIACGGYREFDACTIEIKRVYVEPAYRRQGLGQRVVRLLEQRAYAQGYRYAVLETGATMQDAIALYKSLGFEITENYGDFVGDPLCTCMKKELVQSMEPD